jgi:hypothetical protein
MEDDEVAIIVVIWKTSLSFNVEIASKMTIARMVAIPPQEFFMNPSPSILQKAEWGNILREPSFNGITDLIFIIVIMM